MNSVKNCEPFGYFLAVDLYGCRAGSCDDIALCYGFLDQLVVKLEMKKQSPPFIFRSDEALYPDKKGLSGWVPLIESGIQIHTLSLKHFISIDIYSCRKFEWNGIGRWCQDYFGAQDVEASFLERGLKYNK